MKVSVFGTGYVGLVTAACLADLGNDVCGLDVDADKVAMLQDGRLPTHEPGLAELVQRNAAVGRLRFTTDAPAAVRHGRVQFIEVMRQLYAPFERNHAKLIVMDVASAELTK